jgi:RimJ/RimL family protein N-acetyltransferase
MDADTGGTVTDGAVRLRLWELTDADWYATTALDPLIQRFTSEPPTLTAEQVRSALREQIEREDIASFVICDAATGERLGNIGLRHAGGVGHVSYWLAATARGRGAATRALRLFSRWAFDHLGLTELRLWTYVDNVASRRLAERVAYRRDPGRDEVRQVKGTARHTVAYTLTPGTNADPG